MMKFYTDNNVSHFGGGQLLYLGDEYAFHTEPRPDGCAESVSINEVELMFDDESGRVVFVTGYCPHSGWQPTTLTPPSSRKGALYVMFDKIPVPGSSVSVHPLTERWPVLVDRSSGWVRLGKGDPSEDHNGIEFAPGAIAVLNDARLVAIWLHPENLEYKSKVKG